MFKFKRLVVSALAGLVTASLLVTINLLTATDAQDSVTGRIEQVKIRVQITSAAGANSYAQVPAARAVVHRL